LPDSSYDNFDNYITLYNSKDGKVIGAVTGYLNNGKFDSTYYSSFTYMDKNIRSIVVTEPYLTNYADTILNRTFTYGTHYGPFYNSGFQIPLNEDLQSYFVDNLPPLPFLIGQNEILNETYRNSFFNFPKNYSYTYNSLGYPIKRIILNSTSYSYTLYSYINAN
jgi:hypothetical protein